MQMIINLQFLVKSLIKGALLHVSGFSFPFIYQDGPQCCVWREVPSFSEIIFKWNKHLFSWDCERQWSFSYDSSHDM